MEQFAHISVSETAQKLQDNQARLVDIRDEHSFAESHIPGAWHLTNGTLQTFMNDCDFETPVIVCCYHGISSQQAAQFLIHQGFEQVYSMDGGFAAWRLAFPTELATGSE
ncbi:thiosulfate sulfurtransferase GlpE [Aestuariibacter halophilus]|uniref:Thiosulfate sulfurtransferase GlpE n=1 Tax=Fluctibacter halophilus TaxID=226011 RepID=A0ABS8GAU0_9ALTE|nr:thiosulfate sulfurtransferase GlpE [Aestuariibacter halophilus]MCC2617523.1 thiosulfate sulfurtransferase GlpE [Aestuariibacter halophilus]